MKHLLATIIIFFLIGGIASAQRTAEPPGVISYQGMISSQDGKPLADGEYPITVTLYGDVAGTVKVWSDTYLAPVRDGVFNIYLGSGNVPLPASSQMDRALWIGTRVAGGEEMRPLTRLSASPYAINVPDNSITTSKLADGAVTEEKMNVDYISGVSVNGKKIAINGKVLNIQAGKDIEINYDETSQSLVIGSPAGAGAGREKEGKGRGVQGTSIDSWAMEGDGVDPNGNPVPPDNIDDYIGTSNLYNNIPFTVKVNGERVMYYQPNGVLTPSIIGGYFNNAGAAAGDGNIIAGGGTAGFPNTIDGRFNVIGGGVGNSFVNSGTVGGTIGGGHVNRIGSGVDLAHYAVIAGGFENVVTGIHATIGGGRANNISALYGTVAGGIGNIVSGSISTIAGGDGNQVSRLDASIGGGYHNLITGGADYATIAGGYVNTINGPYGAIDGGASNSILNAGSSFDAIGGGQSNQIGSAAVAANYATISGGFLNSVTATYGTIGGGKSSSVSAVNSTVGGGIGNIISGSEATIAGGDGNQVSRQDGAIGGGYHNLITGNADYGTIAGGYVNTINGQYGAIGGGASNSVLNAGSAYNAIGGGRSNQIGSAATAAPYSTIGGGYSSTITAPYSTIGGGSGNNITGEVSTIAGGGGNRIDAADGAIGGGAGNLIVNTGLAAAIPGGFRLTAQSYGQTVIGVQNIPKGTLAPGSVPNDEPILIVGNGIQGSQSNAFEVSYNGHSTVFHNTGGAIPVILGATYVDNIVYAWGDINRDGETICGFGIDKVDHLGAGWYQVTMETIDPYGNPVALGCGSVTATISSERKPGEGWDGSCLHIGTSQIEGNRFDIYISDRECNPVDAFFMFKVTGRP